MRQSLPQQLSSRLKSFLPKKNPRPGFFTNIMFLVIAFGMMVFIAHSDLVTTNPLQQETQEPEHQDTPLFSKQELSFFNDTITSLLESTNFNGSVLMAKKGEIIYDACFGYADIQNNTIITSDTPFQLASISKTFTAAAVLMLENRGALSVGDRVQSHIPCFPYPDVTIRHLLNHTSGLPNYMYLVERYWEKQYPPTNEDLLNLFVKHYHHLNFRPGSRFRYSNTGYAFLGLLIERVSNQSFPDFIRKEIFAPLSMDHSFVYDIHQNNNNQTKRAFGFRRWRNTYIEIPDGQHDGIMGDKGVFSTARDLYLWDRAIANNQLLPDSIWEKASGYTILDNNQTAKYGMGWRVQNFRNKHVAYHPGQWSGFRTILMRFVEDDTALIILNNTNRDISFITDALQNILFCNEPIAGTEEPALYDPLVASGF